ncbi:MAG: photosynthetic complex assembly protein [Brevundimonas subvibrioides]|uniref:Photosynthetic complex assembly protein n=1 Tax=Brevundimonas subvibrioides TaxID=74313 RepID=A0A258FW80_9CAUL|nr:MAG: photosynthetic complex assembly protein [Brevundimonas subvibrioides]
MSAAVGQEHEGEPVRGLPGHLPEGEHILWQGAPDWKVLARTSMRADWVALYFGALAAWNLGNGLAQDQGLASALTSAAWTLAAGSIAVGLLVGYAVLVARTTVYTMTNKRFVLRHGVALSKCFNIPYRSVATAGLKLDGKGFGDIPMGLADGARIAYPHLWPHVRPLTIMNPQPMMRALPDAASVAERFSLQLQLAASAADKPFVAEPVRAGVRPERQAPSSGQPAAA